MIDRQTNKQTHRHILKNVHYSIRIYIIRGYISILKEWRRMKLTHMKRSSNKDPDKANEMVK